MIPAGHTSLLITDSQRGRAWELGLAKRGMHGKRVATRGVDQDKGDFYVVVPDSELAQARRLVSAVLAGKESLPKISWLKGPLFVGALLVVLFISSMIVLAVISAAGS